MKRLIGAAKPFCFAVAVFAVAGGVGVLAGPVGNNYGPMMLQNAGSDMDSTQQAAFKTNLNLPSALGYTPLNKAGDTATGLIGFTVSATASAAGSTQGTCTAITAQTTIFTTVAANTGACLNSTVGVPQTIVNQGANVLSIYPPSGAAIEGLSTNAPVGVAVGGRTTFRLATSTQAYAN